jgi:hypothetical protein
MPDLKVESFSGESTVEKAQVIPFIAENPQIWDRIKNDAAEKMARAESSDVDAIKHAKERILEEIESIEMQDIMGLKELTLTWAGVLSEAKYEKIDTVESGFANKLAAFVDEKRQAESETSPEFLH